MSSCAISGSASLAAASRALGSASPTTTRSRWPAARPLPVATPPAALWAEGKLQLDTGDRGDLAKDYVSRTGVQAPLSGYQRHPEVIPFNLSGVMLFEAGQNIRILTYLAAPENRVIYGVAGDDPWQPNFDYTYIDLTLTG
jgi:hypothetical protein